MTRNPDLLQLKISAKGVPQPVLDAVRRPLDRFLGFDAFNKIYARLPPGDRLSFSKDFLAEAQVNFEFDGEPISTIPATGPLIVISNHPFGLIEGFGLDAMLLSVRPDATVMAVHVLAAIPELRDRIIFVGRRGIRRKRNLSVKGWRQSYRWVAEGHALLVFPGGGVSRFDWRRRAVFDNPWTPHVAALIRKTGAAVLPIYVHGHNGWLSQIMGFGAPALEALRIVKEATNKRGQTVRATIGGIIHADALAQFETDEERTAFLRQETEKLAR